MLKRIEKHQKGVSVAIVSLLIVVLVLCTALEKCSSVVLKEKSSTAQVKVAKSVTGETTGDIKYRENAKFRILEIVPYRGMAEIGYGIEGEEPIDITRIKEKDVKEDLAQLQHNTEIVLKWDGTKKHLVNQNSFVKSTLKEALQLSESQVKKYIDKKLVDVLVVEPEQINAHPELIEESDYIYIHDDFANGGNDYARRILYLYEVYHDLKSNESPRTDVDKSRLKCFQFEGNGNGKTDLSINVIEKLFMYGVIKEMPLTVPGYTIKNEETGHTNIQKLGYALALTVYMQQHKILSAQKSYEKLFKTSHKTGWDFWNIKEMVQYLCGSLKVNCDELVTKILNYYSSAVDNDFVGDYHQTTVDAFAHGGGAESGLFSKMSSSDAFSGKIVTTEDEKWCEGVKNNSRDVAITIYNAYAPEFVVLDVEPDNKFDLTSLDVKSWVPADIRIRISVVKMTMSEFVGIVNDLNSDYDMIYFGNNINKMTGNKLYYTGIKATSGTLTDMQGDGVKGTDFLYSGNDITERMAKKVKAFMDAGYPVAYASDLVDATKVNNDTNIYDFLKSNSSSMYMVEEKEKESYGEITKVKMLSGKAAEGLLNKTNIKLGKPLIYETLSDSVEEYDGGSSASIGSTGLSGLEINIRHGAGKYLANLYIDTDHNGIYNEWVEDNGALRIDNHYEKPVWSTVFNAGQTVSIGNVTIPQSAMLGVVSYKIEVVKLSKDTSSSKPLGIRANITGHVKCAGTVKQIKVLQLADFEKYPEMDLSSNSSEARLFNKYAKSSIVTDRFHIAVTAKDIFKEDLGEINFQNYDVILAGFVDPEKKMGDADGLLNKLARAAEKGKGVIITRDMLSAYNNSTDPDHWGTNMNHRLRTLLGMDRFKAFSSGAKTADSTKMTYTYSVLNKYSNSKYFEGLQKDITKTNTVARINEAKIARYPYVIEQDSQSRTDGFHTKSGIYQVDVNQKDEDAVDGVAYYCLDGEDRNGNYSVSPKDVRNNYYLWRKDTVFYSGITPESFTSGYDNEVKLFVNTIISAYGLERSVDIEVTNLNQVSDFATGKTYILYADVDFTEKTLLGSRPVKFKLSTKGMSSPVIKVRFYKADGEGNKVSGKLRVYRSGNKFETSGSGSGVEESTVSTLTEYTFVYPFEYLNQGENENILIEAVATEKGKTIQDTALVKAIRRSMFDLD